MMPARQVIDRRFWRQKSRKFFDIFILGKRDSQEDSRCQSPTPCSCQRPPELLSATTSIELFGESS
eukprot:scaffold32409_cov66-Cyclotella_meneghiniana.AAC.2